MIRAIAAVDDKRGIAKNGAIPWDIPADRQYFANTTAGSTVIMGAATYTTLQQPLAGRRNVVVSRTAKTLRNGFELIADVEDFIKNTEEDIWIIGGAGLYESTLHLCDELHITHVTGDFICDRFFPDWSAGFARYEQMPVHQENGYSFTISLYRKTGKP